MHPRESIRHGDRVARTSQPTRISQLENARAGERARAAARILAATPRALKDQALCAGADSLRARQNELLAANAKDMAAAQERGLRASLLDRLALDAVRVEAMAAGLEAVAGLEDPVGPSWRAGGARMASTSRACACRSG